MDDFADARDAWLRRVLTSDKLLSSEKTVGAFLALSFNRKAGGVAWPSLETIADGVGIARSTAATAIQHLKEHGFLKVEPGGGRRNQKEGISNKYWMLPSDGSGCKHEQPSDVPDCNQPLPSDGSGCKEELPSDLEGSYRPAHRTQTPDRTPDKESLSRREGGSRSSARRQPVTPPPESISEEMIAYAVDKAGWNLARSADEFDKFRDHHLAKGNAYSSWAAAWRTWVRRGVGFDQQRTVPVKTIDQEGKDVGSHRRQTPRRQSNTDRLLAGR